MTNPVASERIERLKSKYRTQVPQLSVQRAQYYTESWKQTEGKGTPVCVRTALAMKNVYENMTHYLDPDDRIAGYWTEFFLGMPIDIERGVFNQVLETELDRHTIMSYRARSLLRSAVYMIRTGALFDFWKNQKIMRETGSVPLNLGFDTMSEREINPYQIDPQDKAILKKELLPFWKGRTIVDYLEKALLKEGLYSKNMHEFVLSLPANTSRQVVMISTAATIASYQGHVILDYSQVLDKGLLAMKAEVQKLINGNGNLSGEQKDFLKSIEIALEGVIIFAQRLAERIGQEIGRESDPQKRTALERMYETCKKSPLERPETFEQAVQALWTVKTAVELAHPVNLHCFGRLDQILYPFYKQDLDSGRISREQARELLEELLLKVMSQNIRPESNILANFYHRYLGSTPVTLGGLKPNGEDGTNELTYLFIEAAARSKAITNISVRVHPKSPDKLLNEVAQELHDGTSSYALFNDAMNIEAMKRRGFSEADARDYAVMGCVEMTCPGKTGSMSANALLLSRLLDLTLRNGDSRLLAAFIKGEGLKTGAPDSFNSFEDLLSAFQEQGVYAIKKLTEASNLRDRLFAEMMPAPYISAFIDGCLAKKKDVTRGGGKYDLSGISMINSIANLTDSLYVIKKLVFEQKKYTVRQLLDAIDCNFEGHEQLYQDITNLSGKWGNGSPETDQLAKKVMKVLFEETYNYRTFKGGPFVVYVISMTTHTIDGRLSIATPDGRCASTPFAASCNPYNVEKAGVTGALRSVAVLPFEDVMGCAVNMKFHPTGIGENPEARAKWAALIRTYFQLGGAQIQPTVASAETLRLAQTEPENYRDLIVKVGGYSTYFVDLGREIQEEVISRTEHR
jgi:trans-4-hydroxy-L-proline dehydratase